MKRFLTYIGILVFAAACSPKLEIEYNHEKQAFETRADRILVEAILPQATAADDEVYIIGPFNGGDDAIGNSAYLLTRSANIPQKWGVYLNPGDFLAGKTLADGFTFYNEQQGYERDALNKEVKHTLTIGAGQWANVYADKWEAYFIPPEEEPAFEIPEHDGVRVYIIDQTGWDAIALYQWGDVNDFGGGWPGAQVTGTIKLGDQEYKYFEYGDDIFGLGQNLIFNNNGGGTQLGDYALTFAEGVQDYWFLVTADGVEEIDAPSGGGEIKIPDHDGVRVWVDDQTGWDSIALYQWGDVNDFGGSWPGAQVAGTADLGGITYKYFEYGDDVIGLKQNLIFNNNNNGTQLSDYALTFEEGVKDYWFQVTAEGATLLDGPGGSGGGEEPPTPEVPNDPVTIYVQDLSGWEAITLYMWGDKELCGGWPGIAPAEKTVKIGSVNYKVFTVADALGRSENLIFNNNGGGEQTADWEQITLTEEVFVKVAPGAEKNEISALDPRNPDIKILISNKTDWEEITLYAWGDAEAFGGWPGATPVNVETVKGVDYLVFGLPADMAGKSLNLILNNNGGGKQLSDFAIKVPEEELFLTVNAEYSLGDVEGNPRGEASTIYVVNKQGWETLNLYAWGDAEVFGGWAGAAGTKAGTWCGQPVYTFDVSADASGKNENLIFNNGAGDQFDALTTTLGEDLYLEIENSACTTTEPATRVYVIDETGWDEIALYVWGTTDFFGSWPGALPAGTQEIGGVTYKYFDVPATAFGNTANFILNNNNNGVQLENFDCLKGQTVTRDFYFHFTADNVTVVE